MFKNNCAKYVDTYFRYRAFNSSHIKEFSKNPFSPNREKSNEQAYACQSKREIKVESGI